MPKKKCVISMKNKTLENYKFPKIDLFFYLSNVYKNKKLKSFYKIFHKHVRRPWSRKVLHTHQPSGYGLEVGCGCWTIAPANRTILSDGFKDHAGSNSLAKVFFDAAKIPYHDGTFSFIHSEHVLEHIYNPFPVLFEWKRVLKKGGKVFLFLPHSERTFDRNRSRTNLDGLKERLDGNEAKIKKSILEDWIVNVINKGLAKHYSSYTRQEMLEFGLIHYNVWTPSEVLELLLDTGFRIVEVHSLVPDRKDSFLIICETPK